MNIRCIGLDLAWSPRNNSAAVVLEANDAVATWSDHAERLGDDAEVLAFLLQSAGAGPALIAIDAPLIVPNLEGARPVDRQITSLFGRYDAGCYPAYRSRPGGCARGERIVDGLSTAGFLQDPYIQPRRAVRRVFEVYPHPATLSLFELDVTLMYKARPKRSLDSRRKELTRLRDLLTSLRDGQPAMFTPATVTHRHVHALRGAAFKHYEDLLDAAICAYIACYAWYWGPESYQVYVYMSTGYILVPMTRWMQQRLGQG